MVETKSHDPVTAITEADATGRTAEVFADIRGTLDVPLVTAIWRTLEAVNGGLEAVWAAARPIYQSGQAEALLIELDAAVDLPRPQPLSAEQLSGYGLAAKDRADILTILDAYNRANRLNLIALTALMRRPSGHAPNAMGLPPPRNWPVLKPLLEQHQIAPDHWTLLQNTVHIGSSVPGAALPTLWRHLIHWPGLVQAVIGAFEPLHNNGALFQAVENTTTFVENYAPRLSELADRSIALPQAAILAVESYVGQPPSVSRMSTFGACTAAWLRDADWG